jgi:hypothetical protein
VVVSQFSEAGARSKTKAKETVSVRITQQFRERNNMTYELDCSGIPLVLRVFFPVDTDPSHEWRIEARTGHPLQGMEATASAQSRAEAFQVIARDWHRAMPVSVSDLDWTAIERAMSAVRAI